MAPEVFGLIAGKGLLPVLMARKARDRGLQVVSIAFSDEIAQGLSPHSKVHSLGLGQVGKILKTLKNEGVTKVAMAGKVEKSLLYKNLKIDFRAIKALAALKDRKDDTLMLAVIGEIEKEGMTVVDQRSFFQDLFPVKGSLTKKRPSKKQQQDIQFGFEIAKESARLDIGQTVVVKNGAVMAVEAIEGTDEAIKRGCLLCEKGGVVVKVEKPSQDPRFDIPTVGLNTIETLSRYNGGLLAVEAGKTIFVEREKTVERADQLGIVIVAV